MIRFRKGDWVRYNGPSPDFTYMIGQITGSDRSDSVYYHVVFRSRGGGTFSHGVYPIHLTKVDKGAKAHEIACRALGLPWSD